jgi:hypothetical protein
MRLYTIKRQKRNILTFTGHKGFEISYIAMRHDIWPLYFRAAPLRVKRKKNY